MSATENFQALQPSYGLDNFELTSEVKLQPGDIGVFTDSHHYRLSIGLRLFEPGEAGGYPAVQLASFWDGASWGIVQPPDEERPDHIKLINWEARVLGQWRKFDGDLRGPSLILANDGRYVGMRLRPDRHSSMTTHYFSFPNMAKAPLHRSWGVRYVCEHWGLFPKQKEGNTGPLIEFLPDALSMPFIGFG